MSVEEATMVLAGHELQTWPHARKDRQVECGCGALVPDHPAHLADALARAGLLRDAPVTPRPFQDAPD